MSLLGLLATVNGLGHPLRHKDLDAVHRRHEGIRLCGLDRYWVAPCQKTVHHLKIVLVLDDPGSDFPQQMSWNFFTYTRWRILSWRAFRPRRLRISDASGIWLRWNAPLTWWWLPPRRWEQRSSLRIPRWFLFLGASVSMGGSRLAPEGSSLAHVTAKVPTAFAFLAQASVARRQGTQHLRSSDLICRRMHLAATVTNATNLTPKA